MRPRRLLQTRQRMRDVLDEIRSGQFAREWMREHRSGRARYDALMEADVNHPMEEVGDRLRARMSWLHDGAEQAEVA